MFYKADQTMKRANLILSLPILLMIWAEPASAYQQTFQPAVAPKPEISESFLGVFTDSIPVTRTLQRAQMPEKNQGVLVTYLLPSSPAATAGIKPNDILISYNQKPLSSPYQLKMLVTHSVPTQPVTIQLKRGMESRSVDVKLATRIVNWTTSPTIHQQIYGPAIVRLQNRNDTAVFLPQDNMLIPGTEFLWRIRSSPATPAQQVPASVAAIEPLNQAITLSTSDGNNFQLKVSRTDSTKKSPVYEWEGTEEEIQQKMDTAPAKVATDVRSSLNWAKTQVTLKRGIRFQVQPRLEGQSQVLRVLMSRPDKDGSIRLLQIDHTIDDKQPMKADALLKIEPIASELQSLSPVIRAKIETTLRKTQLPAIRVEVERSQ